MASGTVAVLGYGGLVHQEMASAKGTGNSEEEGEEEILTAFANLLFEYGAFFSISPWMAAEQKRSAIFRYLKQIGLGHHFGSSEEVGAPRHREANRQALAELLTKVDAKYDRGNKENLGQSACGLTSNIDSGKPLADPCEVSLHLPATRMRKSLDIQETDPLALDEAARKMTGRPASELGPVELAYIIELQQEQLKAKLAEKHKQMEKQAKRDQYDRELNVAQMGKRVEELERLLSSTSKAANGEDKTAELTVELRSLRKQRMGLEMELSLEATRAAKQLEELKHQERIIDEIAHRERAKLKKETAKQATQVAVQKKEGREARSSSVRPTHSKPSTGRVSRKVILNDVESADEPGCSHEQDPSSRESKPSASSTRAEVRVSKIITLNADEENNGKAALIRQVDAASRKSQSSKKPSERAVRAPISKERSSRETERREEPAVARTSRAIVVNTETEPEVSTRQQTRSRREEGSSATNTKSSDKRSTARSVGHKESERKISEEKQESRISRTITINTEPQEQKATTRISKKIVINNGEDSEARRGADKKNARSSERNRRSDQALQHQQDQQEYGGEDMVEACEAEREALLEMRHHSAAVPAVWGIDADAPPPQREEVFLKRLRKARKERTEQMKREAGENRKTKSESGRRRRVSTPGSNGGLIVVLDTPWAAKRRTARTAAHKPKPLHKNMASREEEVTSSDDEAVPDSQENSAQSVPTCEDRWDDGHCDTEEDEHRRCISAERDAEERPVPGNEEEEVAADEHASGLDSEDEDEEDDDDEEDEQDGSETSESRIWRTAKGRRWERDRHERERINGQRRGDAKASASRRASARVDKQASITNSSGARHARTQMQAFMDSCLSDLQKPPTTLLLEDLSDDEDQQPDANRTLQVMIEIFEARAARHKTTASKRDDELARMSAEECKRVMWGDDYRVRAS